jgi:hypothetical protein
MVMKEENNLKGGKDKSTSESIVTSSHILIYGVVIIVCLLSLSCSTTSYRDVYPTLLDGKYDSEFPYRGCSGQLEQISETVRMVSCIAYYKSWVFPLEAKVRLENIHDPFLKEKAEKEVYLNQTASGSATVIYCQNKRIALLTCAHVVDFSDTIFTYYRGENNKQTEFIQSIAVKDRQTNYVAAIQGVHNLEILLIDRENDLALIGQIIESSIVLTVAVFNYPIGKAKELEWGAFVYLFGYPAGYRVVTKAIVSSPNRDKYGSFLTDAVFNKGFSGGIVLAIRDGVPNFELVGMMKLVPGYQHYYLTPAKEGDQIEFDPNIPFKGNVFAESRTDIIYGVAPAIPAELIVDFLQTNQQKLVDEGYDLQSFIERPSSVKSRNK